MNTFLTFFQTGTFDLFLLVNLVLMGYWYLWAVKRARLTGQWSRWKTFAFLTGLALLALTYLGPIAAWSHTFFWAHMTQHLVVMMAVAPLLVLGAPTTLWFQASSPHSRRRWVLPILRSRAVSWLINPYFTWFLFAAVLLGMHFTGFYNWALLNHDVDYFIEQPLYFIAAFLFYFPLIGSNLQPRRPSHSFRLASLALMMIPEAITGAIIYFAPVMLYPFFDTERPFGPAALDDQHFSGALMWALVMVVDSGWMMLAAAEWFTSEERAGRRIDREIAEELAAEIMAP
ncbi:MAG: cytochrome c oxidase assembly protein [Candidatus Nanopelagicales bacterium]|nr:cytochrome c oxidase assembly protein [Candidatus Nanopelagicales bacterium]